MTDDPNDDLEARLRRDLGTIADAVPDTPVVVPLTVAPSRRIGVGLAAAAVVAVVGLVAAAVWWGGDSSDGTGPAAPSTAAPSTSAPIDEEPPPDDGPYRIWMSSEVISTDGADIVFAVVGPETDELYGVETHLDRWNVDAWDPVTTFGSCLDFWFCWGQFPPAGEEAAVPGIGVAIGPSMVGGTEYVHISSLREGTYRLRKEVATSEATAMFEVADAASLSNAAPVPDLDSSVISVEPVAVGAAGATVRVGGRLADGFADVRGVASVSVEQWSGSGELWAPRLALDLGSSAEPVEVRLPALAPGAYRIVATGEDGPVVGRFWVDGDVPSTLDCAVLPTLDELLGDAAAGFDGPAPPTEPLRSSFTPGGFRVQWDSPDTTTTYSYPAGSVIDLVGERTAQDGPLLLWYQGGFGDVPSTIEAWVDLPECGEGFDRAGFSVTGGTEEENVALALRLGRALAERYNPDFAVDLRADCPDEDTPDPETPNEVRDVWMWCRTAPDAEAELVPVRTVFGPDVHPGEVIFRSLGQPWDGFETAVPIELWTAPKEGSIDDGVLPSGGGVLTIDIDYDFAAAPINNFSTSSWSTRYLAQIAANAFQFATIDAIDLDTLCCGEWEGLYTRADWEEWKAAQEE